MKAAILLVALLVAGCSDALRPGGGLISSKAAKPGGCYTIISPEGTERYCYDGNQARYRKV